MKRRSFMAVLGAAGLAGSLEQSEAAESNPMIIELRRLYFRNTPDNMVQRANDFFAKSYLPALKRAGIQTVGAFGNVVGEASPYLLLVSQSANLAAWEQSTAKLVSDEEYVKARDAYTSGPLQYLNMEVTLLRGSKAVPQIEVPAAREDGKSRLFEIRTYESNNTKTLARKIRMFDEGEIDLFRKVGMTPIFFGETIAGARMPNLTYMLAYDDMTAREAAWSKFVSHPEWKKMSTQPGVSDAEIVSSISNALLRPLPFSMIK